MKILKKILLLILLLCLVCPIHSQDNSTVPERTPEQVASQQTNKLQQELNLTPEQCQQMYDINLRYERQRRISNTRSEALERVKNKNAEIQHVLTNEQNNRLQNRRYQRSTIELQPINRTQQPPNTSGPRSATESGANQPFRGRSNDNQTNCRSTNSQSRTNSQIPQTIRRSSTFTPRTPNLQNNTSGTHSDGRSYDTPTRTQTNQTPQNNSSTRSQGTPSNSPAGTSTPAGSNRR
jgi:hypothetical protein